MIKRIELEDLTLETAYELSPKMKIEIIGKMEDLEVLLYNYLQVARMLGGTRGHAVGSIWKHIKDHKEFIISYT
jgi:hypothetical protein